MDTKFQKSSGSLFGRVQRFLATVHLRQTLDERMFVIVGWVFIATLCVLWPVHSAEFPQNDASKPAASEHAQENQEPRWSVNGRVVDGEGNPIRGARVTAHTGVGTLVGGGKGETDANGNFQFTFGPGIRMSNNDVQMQLATISVSMPGYFEKNLSRHGDLAMALRIPDDFESWAGHPEKDIILPGKPRTLNFVLLPGATVSGTLVNEKGKSLAGYSISLKGEQLPPSSSVAAHERTDADGKFSLNGIPTSFRYQLLVSPTNPRPPWNSWASGPFNFFKQDDTAIVFSDRKETHIAKEFQIQLNTSGVNWKHALKIGADNQSIEREGDMIKLVLHPPGEDQSRVEPESIRVVIGQIPRPSAHEPRQFQQAHIGTIQLTERRASLEIPETVAWSFANPRLIKTKLSSTFNVETQFDFVGEKDASRRMLVDVKGLDQDGKTVFQSWRVVQDTFTIPIAKGDRPRTGPSSARVEIPRHFLPDIRTVQIGMRELFDDEITKHADRPSKTNMRISRPNAGGQFVLRFDNPINKYGPGRWSLDPESHQVIVQVFVRDADGKLKKKIFRQIEARPVGDYEVDLTVNPNLFAYTKVSTTFVTIQTEHDKWVDDFFKKGIGTSYKGLWSGDSGELMKIPVAE